MLNINPFRCNVIRSLWNNSQPCFLQNGTRSISVSPVLEFNITSALMAMPTKKRKRIDPQILKLREDRKKRKIEKEIRSLEKIKKTLKPIEEARMPPVLHHEMESRKRLIQVPEDVKEERILLAKEWSRYKMNQTTRDRKNINAIIESQQQALKELQNESIELYKAAIQIDPDLIPFTYTGPSETPPIEGYNRPDGEYIDISKNWLEQWKQKK